MKLMALSVRQPYASLIASGRKTLETRTWTRSYRGDILICASKWGKEEPRGVALCLVTLTNIRPMVAGDALAACIELYPGTYVWELTNLRPVRRIPITGKLGLYEVEVPDDVVL